MSILTHDQARRELLLASIAVALIIAVSVFIYETEDNYIRTQLEIRKCENRWLAAVIAQHNPELYNRLQPLTGGKVPYEIADLEACYDMFKDNQK